MSMSRRPAGLPPKPHNMMVNVSPAPASAVLPCPVADAAVPVAAVARQAQGDKVMDDVDELSGLDPGDSSALSIPPPPAPNAAA